MCVALHAVQILTVFNNVHSLFAIRESLSLCYRWVQSYKLRHRRGHATEICEEDLDEMQASLKR